MNILTDIDVKGEIYINYAFLNYEFKFKSDAEATVSAEYSFSLPAGAVISDARIVDSADCVTQMSVIPLSHASALWNSAETAILRRLDKTKYSLSIGKVDSKGCRLTIKAYAPITDGLTIPVSAEGGMCEIELTLHKISDFMSPTHTLKNIRNGNEISVSTGKVLADRDFRIALKGDTRVNSALVVDNAVGGEMLCRLNAEAEKRKYRRLLIAYDKALAGGVAGAVREFICAAAEEFGGEFAVAEKNEKYYFITDGFVPYTDKALDPIYRFDKPNGNEVDINNCGEDTLKLFLSTSACCEDGFCNVTFGGVDRSECDLLKREHVYGKDNIRKRAKQILENQYQSADNISVYADGAEAEVVCRDTDGCIVYVRYIGEAPNVFRVTRGSKVVSVRIEEIECYRSFAPIGLVYAELMCDKYNRILAVCPPWEIPQIRSKTEEIGIKYSAINSETALAAVTGAGKPYPVRVIIEGEEADVFTGRISMFKEDDTVYTSAESAYLVALCKEVIYMNMRSCGGVYARGEINPDMQKYQTLVCLLALVAAGMAKDVFGIMKDFVGEFAHNSMRVTDDALTADEFLHNEFGESAVIFGGVPDVLTAAKALWQMRKKNNDIFC